MNLLADESVGRQIVERLRKDGHDVTYTAEMEPGISDETVLQKANEQEAMLLTVDKDFGELTYRQSNTPGCRIDSSRGPFESNAS